MPRYRDPLTQDAPPSQGGPTGTRRGFEDWATERVRSGQPITDRNVSIGPGGQVRSSLGRTTMADLWPLLLAGGGIGLGALAAGGAGVPAAAGPGSGAFGSTGGTGLAGTAGAIPSLGVTSGLPGAVGTSVGIPGAAASAGGGAMGYLDTIRNVASVLGRASGQRSDQRFEDNSVIASQNRGLSDLYGTQQGAQFRAGDLDLLRKQFSENARGGRTKQAIIGDLLGNMQDVNVSVPGITNATISGGIRPSAMGATGKSASAEMAKQALLKLLEGDTFTGGEVLPPPQLQGMQKAGSLEKFLDMAGLAGSVFGAATAKR